MCVCEGGGGDGWIGACMPDSLALQCDFRDKPQDKLIPCSATSGPSLATSHYASRGELICRVYTVPRLFAQWEEMRTQPRSWVRG